MQAYVDGMLSYMQVSDDKQKYIIEATMKDDQLKVLKETVSKGWPSRQSSCRPELKPHWNFREELSVHEGMILKGSRIVIPRAMRKEILHKIHLGHLGREKCKHRARQVVFWPQMNQDIDNIVSNCEVCQKYQHKQLREPLKPYPVATRPWQVVGTYLFEVDKEDYVVLVDAYSSYPEPGSISKKSSATVTKVMKSVFARHGIPETVVSDNGPCYNSSEFSVFSKEWGFSHETSSPEHPSSNGLAERAVQTVKNIIKKSAESKDDMQLGLLA